MILYKYVTLEAAQKIVMGSRISFTTSYQFNDPYEMHAISNFTHIANDSDPNVTLLETDYFLLKAGLQCYGVLSLTRNPLNNLMWSHYADEHRGVVIGIDVEEAGFCNKDSNVIPANFGEIIYTKTFPTSLSKETYRRTFDSLRVINSYNEESFDFFKYAYLYKGLDWSYEEEVRVVKMVGFPIFDTENELNNYYSNTNGNWQHHQINEQKNLNLFEFPISSIKEIYFGMNVTGMKTYNSVIQHLSDDVKIKCCGMSLNSYDIITINWK